MSIISKLKEKAENIKKNSNYKKAYDRWEDGDLKDIEKTVQQGANWNKEKSKTGWTNSDGTHFSAKHYQDNYDKDVKALKRVRNEINTRKKMDTLTKGKTNNVDKYKKPRKRDEIDDYLEN